MRTLVLFTRDLRVHDHPALWESSRASDEIVPLFVLDPDLLERSPNRTRFLAECLVDLDRSLAHRGGRLFIREGDVPVRALEVATEARCDAIAVTDDAGRYAERRPERLRALAGPRRIEVRTFPGHAVVEPGAVTPTDGRAAYRVFTPYHRAWERAARRDPLPSPRAIRVPRGLAAGRLPVPASIRPTARELPPGGEAPARKRLRRFLADAAAAYDAARDDLAADATSRLSPALRFGCVSANEVASGVRGVVGAEGFVRQLAWRDFFLQLLADRPSMAWADLRPVGAGVTEIDEAVVRAWASGTTGYPLVDAGMRQLLTEGWMPNRARLVTASFLTRHALVPWQVGARHFSRHLVDGDPANNAGNWQWVAGTGAAPRRSRPLNPVRQAERFDPDGDYVRRHVPELRGVSGDAIRRPWRHPDVLRATGYAAPVLEPSEGGSAIKRSIVPAADTRSVPR